MSVVGNVNCLDSPISERLENNQVLAETLQYQITYLGLFLSVLP